MSRSKIQTEMVTFRAPAGTKKLLDELAEREKYKDRSALILDRVGVSQETALEEGNSGSGVSIPSSSADEGKDKLERAHEAMAKASTDANRDPRFDPDNIGPRARPLLTHAHAANCPCSICTKSG